MITLRLADPSARLAVEGAALRLVGSDGSERRVDASVPAVAAVAARLAGEPGLPEDEVVRSRDAARLYLIIERLRAVGGLAWELWGQGGRIARIEPQGPHFELAAPGDDRALDPHCLLRARLDAAPGDPLTALLEAPGLGCRILLSADGARLAAGLLAGAADEPDAAALRALLLRCGMGTTCGFWSFADRVMHDASRPPDDGRPIDPVPTDLGRHPLPSLPWQRTEAPTSAAAPPSGDILARRRSLRDYAEAAPRRAVVEAMLSRVLAFRAVRSLGAARWVERGFPSAGGLGEITGYVVCRHIEGLDPGVWRHDPLTDRLDRVGERAGARDRLLESASALLQRPGRPPPAVVVLTARIDVLAARYGQLAYRLALLNAGAALAALQLAADDLGLGCCALGTSGVRRLSSLLAAPEHDDEIEIMLAEIAFGARL